MGQPQTRLAPRPAVITSTGLFIGTSLSSGLLSGGLLRGGVANLVDLIDPLAYCGQHDQETERGDDNTRRVSADHDIGVAVGGLGPAALGQGEQAEGE
jgi:hypothetical protein